MISDNNPKKKKRRLIGVLGSLLSLAALSYIAISLISGRDMRPSWLMGLFSAREPVEMADEYNFDVGQNRVFANMGGLLAAAGTLGVQVLDIGGGEALRDPFRMSHPSISANNGWAIVFDIGGTTVRSLNGARAVASIETDSAIISASINRNGWFCVCTQGAGGYRGVATVYNNKGNPVYKTSLSSGYILSALLSPDDRSLAVLNLTDDGSRVTFYHGLDSDIADCAFDFPGRLIVDIWYPPDGMLVAISTESLIAVDKNGIGRELYNFFGKRLGSYTFDADFYALHLLDYSIGFRGQLVTLGTDGKLLGEFPTDRGIVSMSSGSGFLAVLRNDGLSFFSAGLEELALSGDRIFASGASRVLALEGGAALAAGDHSAVIYRITTRRES